MKEPVFLKLSDNTYSFAKFPWAVKIVPGSKMIYNLCRECGVVQSYPSGGFGVTLEGGHTYPDFLGCGAYPFMILSRRVLDDWAREGISNYKVYSVEIVSTDSAKLAEKRPPEYYRVELDGRCQIDLAASGLEVVKHCWECGYLQTRPALADGFQIVPNTWDGSELFRDTIHYPRVTFCTQRVMEIAREHQHTNFRFELMHGPLNRSGAGIDYSR